MRKIKLFCFPYAGGSAFIFNKWRRYLDPAIELIPFELAGKGSRIHEPPYKNITDVVNDVLAFMTKRGVPESYALFGHSLGSTISYWLAQTIRERGLVNPEHIFFSGHSAPHLRTNNEKVYYLMNDDDFRKEVIALGGVPTEFFEQPELLELFLPCLRNDFKLAETVTYNDNIEPLDTNITVLLGREDDLDPGQCEGWKNHTTRLCDIKYFDGGHFFIHQQTEQIVKIINKTLN